MDVEIYGQLTLCSRTGLVVLAQHLAEAAAGGGLHGCTPVKVAYAGHTQECLPVVPTQKLSQGLCKGREVLRASTTSKKSCAEPTRTYE